MEGIKVGNVNVSVLVSPPVTLKLGYFNPKLGPTP